MNLPANIISLNETSADEPQGEKSNSKKVSKFVIILGEDEAYFVFGPLDLYSYHAGIVKRFCELKDIPSGWVKKPDLYEIYGSDYEIKGGGWMEEKTTEKRLRIFGYSTAYGGFEQQDILYLFQNAPDFEDCEIEFDS